LSRFCVTEKLTEPWVTGLKSLEGAFCLYPSTLPMPTETLVPVRNPCWTPKLACLNEVTRKLVPWKEGLVGGAVWWLICEWRKKVGSRLGIAEPANWTLRPLRTPPVVPVPPPALVEPSELAPARAPSDAEDGPCEMLLFTLRSRAPALARSRLASCSLGLRRATSISRLFSSASAMASRRER